VIHRPRTLPADETTTLDGLPITTAARTLLDLATGRLRGRRLEAALDRAELRGRVTGRTSHASSSGIRGVGASAS
jgi:hypothetical protein